jgi:hypothetical protein
MIRNLMALPCMLALVLACGQGRTDGQDTGAAGGAGAESGALPADTGYTAGGIEDTTAAPSIDASDTAAPLSDTAAPTGDTAALTGDTAAPTGDTESGIDTESTDSVSLDQSGAADTESGDSAAVGANSEGVTSDTTY